MDRKRQKQILSIARDAVRAVVQGESFPVPTTDDPELKTTCGCFVTLKNRGRLRGCIGRFASDRPLIETVVEMAKASARSDPRFVGDPITPAELDDLDIEVSVLSPLKKTEDPLNLRLGVDGVYIKRGHASGCFLPQVATETGWDVEQFLSYCCSHKAGLPPDAWRDPRTEVYLFTAEVFEAPARSL